MRRVHTMPFGAELTPDGVRFAFWAPTASEVTIVVDGVAHALAKDADGWCRGVVRSASAGSRYGFRIDSGLLLPDPASRYQPDDVHGQSQVVQPASYDWSDVDWTGRPWEETVLYEVHVGTATPEGTFAALQEKLEDLQTLGITAIELLPIAEFPGRRNWGYDGVLPFAPDATYGTPDDLKRLVERAHALDLMVFLDVVYNHFGPSGNYLHSYAKSFFTDRHQTPWGAGINVDGEGSRIVRNFFLHNALYWLEEYHIDGLRFDAVHAIADDSEPHFIAELATRVRDANPGRHVHLVLENEENQARWLGRTALGRPLLHTAQWADDIHNAWHSVLTGETEGYYVDYADRPLERLGRALAEGFAYQGEASLHRGGAPRGEPSAHLPPSAFVSFLQNHDQIGNRAFGERLSVLVEPEKLALARALLLLSPQVPLLFMGEEWTASTPFLFFVDFDNDPPLSRAVREGRRAEFARFEAFRDENAFSRVPDPTDERSFERSKLDWNERLRTPHSDVLLDTSRLLELRRQEIVPLLKSEFHGSSYDVTSGRLDVTWRFSSEILRLVANFGPDAVRLPSDGLGQLIWSSPGIAPRCDDAVQLPSWSGAVWKASKA